MFIKMETPGTGSFITCRGVGYLVNCRVWELNVKYLTMMIFHSEQIDLLILTILPLFT